MSVNDDINYVIGNLSSMEESRTSEIIEQVFEINKIYDRKFLLIEEVLKDIINQIEKFTEISDNNNKSFVSLYELNIRQFEKIYAELESLKDKTNN